jgi:hypothetical protein
MDEGYRSQSLTGQDRMNELTDETQSENPAEPLSGRSGNLHELLRSLSDTELEAYCLYWSRRRAEYARQRLRLVEVQQPPRSRLRRGSNTLPKVMAAGD